MAKQTFTTGQVLTAAQVNALNSNDFNQTVSVKTAAHTLVVGDRGTRVEFNTSGSVTCTVNSGIFDAGDTLVIQNRGAGVVTVTAGTATVNTSATLALSQYDAGTLYFISASAAIFFNTDAGGGSPLTTKGDLYGFSTLDARIPIGANNTVLTADSTESLGLKWAAPAGGGVKQVVTASTLTTTTRTSDGFSNTALTANITPSATASKIVVVVVPFQTYITKAAGRSDFPQLSLFVDVNNNTRTSQNYGQIFDGGRNSDTNVANLHIPAPILFVDSPNSTSQQTYLIRLHTGANAGADYGEGTFSGGEMILMEI